MPELSPAQWAEVEGFFAQAVELPPQERLEFLRLQCQNEDVRRETISLLDHARDGSPTFEALIAEVAASLPPEPNPDERLVGTRLGSYRLVAIAGYGGMGAVYRAVREDDEFEHEVAIKMVRAAAESPSAQQRFRQERQILARLSHPNIARLLDGGSTPEGVPYLVMEFIRGEPISEWCQRQSLTIERRLQIFLQVCDGIQATHRERIVHRDIKPANILVSAEGIPKLLDFGIARILSENPQRPNLSATRFQAMTPEYACPEQVRGERITTATDIYALGLVLYEILTGLKAQKFPDYTPSTIERIVCQEQPTAPGTLESSLSGDIDNIIRMAIRKEPERRYRSVADLSEDVRRYLSHQPVTARPDTLSYRSAKFLRRHRVAANAGVGSAVGVALIASLWFGMTRPPRTPRLLQVLQLTQNSHVTVGDRIATDGERLYFTERAGGKSTLATVSVSGGAASPYLLPQRLVNPSVLEISPDGSNLLILAGDASTAFPQPLWIVRKTGGPPRRVGDVTATYGTWSRDGNRIFFLDEERVSSVNVDGTDRRDFAGIPAGSYEIHNAPSPLPSILRLSVFNRDMGSSAIWEAAADGSGLRRVFPGKLPGLFPDALYNGDWTSSGRYFLLRSRRNSISTFWALRTAPGFLRTKNDPVMLYSTPLQTRSFTPSRDGKRIYFAATQQRSEFVRYDVKRKQFRPFLPGVAGGDISLSPDQRRVAYTTIPQYSLWTSGVDGSEPVQLVPTPDDRSSSERVSGMRVFQPSWSPDGKSVVFVGSAAGKPNRIYEMAASGGKPQAISPEQFEFRPSWSPDGNTLLVARVVRPGDAGKSGLYLIGRRTQKIELLPGSEAFKFGAWSPDSRYIAAMGPNELKLFDLRTRKWSLLLSEEIASFCWSHDGKSITYQNSRTAASQPIIQIRVSDRKKERLMSWKQLPQSSFSRFALLDMSADDAPIATVFTSNSEIYALDVDLP